jgi:hypothetical protein
MIRSIGTTPKTEPFNAPTKNRGMHMKDVPFPRALLLASLALIPVQADASDQKLKPFLQAKTPQFYVLNFRDIYIRNTRSRHEDTDFATVKIKVGGSVQTATMALGDHNNGPINFNLAIKNIVIPDDTTQVAFSIDVINKGSGLSDALLRQAISELLPDAINAVIPGTGEVVDALDALLGIPNLIVPNCDGPVVLYTDVTNGHIVTQQTANGSTLFTWWFVGTDYGYQSAAGCGSNSNYGYTVLLSRASGADGTPVEGAPIIGTPPHS